MKSRDLIFISISQLDVADLEAFVQSVRGKVRSCRIVCFAGDTTASTLSWLEQNDIEVVRMREHLVKIPFLSRKLNPLKWLYPLMRVYWRLFLSRTKNLSEINGPGYRFVKELSRICTMRFFYYFEYLSAHRTEIDRVILTDVRDVLFLSDPFADKWDSSLHCFLEADGHTIASNVWNKYWIEKIGGQQLLNEIGARPISCAGVTYGTTAIMMDYLRIMCQHLSSTIDRLDLDQGFHNLIIWKNEISEVCLGTCGGSEVLTMGLYPDELVRFGENDSLLNQDGSTVKIVHQYDRKPNVASRLLRKVE